MAEQEKQIAIKLATGNGIANVAQDRNPWVTGGEGNAERTSRPVSNYATTGRRKKGRQYTGRAPPLMYGPTLSSNVSPAEMDGKTGMSDEN